MELIERAGFLSTLQTRFAQVVGGEGHSILVSGEPGIGKTSLVRTFCRDIKNQAQVLVGTCDALFTPRPLAPLYDIAWQMKSTIAETAVEQSDRAVLFARFLYELISQEKPVIIFFEDIHWADEATLDFIKFLGRRITRSHCLFILTFRDDAIYSHHPLGNVLGQLPPDSFTRLQLVPLSREAVKQLAAGKGYSGEDVYSISGGNPFYVHEILASYSPGIPENVKDSILAVYNALDEKTKQVWEILSVLPTGFESKYLEKIEPLYTTSVQKCFNSRILIMENSRVYFKHELYRRTIETSLSPFVRIALNKKILDLFLESFEAGNETERIIHHAKNANEYELVVKYAPAAARQAAVVGAHLEASRLYLTAIEYYQGNDKNILVDLYQAYAYECYLTSQIKEAIIYETKALAIHKEGTDREKTGNSLRFLSRLWWFEGNRRHSESYANEAVELLQHQPVSRAKGMALSNMSQLKMLADEHASCIFWGEQAIAIAKELGDEETLSHALNNVGAVKMYMDARVDEGVRLLLESLAIAQRHAYHEHAARAYTNLGTHALAMKEYVLAKKYLEAGIQFCEERDLDSWGRYMLSWKARMNFETGDWDEAFRMATELVNDENLSSIVRIGALAVVARIKMRRGDGDVEPLLEEAKEKALKTMELQRMIPSLVAMLEYEWITGKAFAGQAPVELVTQMSNTAGNRYEKGEFAFWLAKARNQQIVPGETVTGYLLKGEPPEEAAANWERIGCPYEQALLLFEGNEEDKRRAIAMADQLGAHAVYEKMKLEMRTSGIRSIPRGLRKSTRANAAQLTGRELDVLQLLREGLQNKEIGARLFISAKTVDHHISAILFKLDVNSRVKAVKEATEQGILK